jgi:hypothetical protein
MADVTAHPEGTVTGDDLAEVNYRGYTAESGNRSLVSGELLPEFSAVPEKIRGAWRAGTRAVVRHVVRHGELTQALAALRRLADPSALLSPDLHETELRARIAYAADVYARLAATAGQLGLDDDTGDGRPAGPGQEVKRNGSS